MPRPSRFIPEDQLARLRAVQDIQTTAFAERAQAAAAVASAEQRREQTLAALDRDVDDARRALLAVEARLTKLMPIDHVSAVTDTPAAALRRARKEASR